MCVRVCVCVCVCVCACMRACVRVDGGMSAFPHTNVTKGTQAHGEPTHTIVTYIMHAIAYSQGSEGT